LRWIIYNGGNVINSMWSSIALWFASNFLIDCFVMRR